MREENVQKCKSVNMKLQLHPGTFMWLYVNQSSVCLHVCVSECTYSVCVCWCVLMCVWVCECPVNHQMLCQTSGMLFIDEESDERQAPTHTHTHTHSHTHTHAHTHSPDPSLHVGPEEFVLFWNGPDSRPDPALIVKEPLHSEEADADDTSLILQTRESLSSPQPE